MSLEDQDSFSEPYEEEEMSSHEAKHVPSFPEELGRDLKSSVFEDEDDVAERMKDYGIPRKSGVGEIEIGITNEYRVAKDGVEFAPLFGERPRLALEASIQTNDGKTWSLQLYEIINSVGEARFEYLLEAASLTE